MSHADTEAARWISKTIFHFAGVIGPFVAKTSNFERAGMVLNMLLRACEFIRREFSPGEFIMIMRKQRCLYIAIGLGLVSFGMASSMAGTGLAIVPPALTNDFIGNVNLDITGLAVGKTVRVEKFLDANGNGVIDAGDMLVQSFTLTDGQLPLIGGVRNSNVPGDDDALTNGQITAGVFYPNLSSTGDRIAGNYLVRVSDPANGFTPAIQTFTVSQKVQPQGVSGQMIAADSGLPMTNVVVVLGTQNGNGVIGAITDGSGNYTIYCAPGNYDVICIAPGFVSDQNAGGVQVSSNVMATVNLTNAAGTTTITGTVSDSSSGVGLPGLFMQAQNNNNLFTGTFTDTNGNFILSVPPDQWKLKLDGATGALLGYLRQDSSVNVDTTGGSVSNANFQMTRATALVYGSIKDAQSNAVSVMRMDAQDNGNLFDAVGQSDLNGNYSIAVAGSSSLNVSPDNNSLAAANLIGSGTNVVMTNGQALAINFIIQQVTAHLIGRLIDGNSNAVANMSLVVFPFSTNGSAGPNLNPQTDDNGNFDIGVFGGSWNLDLEINAAASRKLIGSTPVFNVTDGVDITNITLVAQIATAQISGTVTDNHGAPISGVRPFGNATANGTAYLVGATTDTNGFYSFAVFPANWTVGVNNGDLPARGFQDPPTQSATISGTNNQTVNFVAQPITNTPPTLGQFHYSNGQFQFQVNGMSGRNYRVDASTNLTSWVPLATNTAFGGSFTFIDTNAPAFKSRFYRAALTP